MKNVFFVSLMAIGLVTGINNSACSQITAGLITKVQTVAGEQGAYAVAGVERVDTRVMRNFLKSFHETGDQKWYRYNDRYVVYFDSNAVHYRIEYDSKGNWSGTEKVYKENKLDRSIRKVVKSVYFDFAITGVQEILLPGAVAGPVYIVHLEDKYSFKEVCVYDNELTVLKSFARSL